MNLPFHLLKSNAFSSLLSLTQVVKTQVNFLIISFKYK